ncbi:MAG: polysaccharide biosynthesis/export family protein [Acidobacteriota bacterium]|nr:polysaccharide biosynthesis/export family protein [Acidobacteriota bacterium]
MALPARSFSVVLVALVGLTALVAAVSAAEQADAAQSGTATSGTAATTVVTPPDYVIGPDDALSVVFWREKDMSGDVVVRPDGMISLPLLNDVMAAGLTPEQLRERLTQQASVFLNDPQATVVVKEINSRKVYITGEVEKPGSYPLNSRLSVMQLIAMAGGLKEYAKSDRIVVMRVEQSREVRYRFDYKKVLEGKNLEQNLDLRPGDTVVVP